MSYLAIAKKVEERLKETQAIEGGKIQAATPEALAVSVLAETEPDEAGKILRVWRETFGMDLDRDRVTRQLQDLRQWQSRWRR